jgi:hypothetical protein
MNHPLTAYKDSFPDTQARHTAHGGNKTAACPYVANRIPVLVVAKYDFFDYSLYLFQEKFPSSVFLPKETGGDRLT